MWRVEEEEEKSQAWLASQHFAILILARPIAILILARCLPSSVGMKIPFTLELIGWIFTLELIGWIFTLELIGWIYTKS